MDEENKRGLIMGKIDVTKIRSAFYRLVVLVLSEGYTVNDVVATKTQDVLDEKYSWVKTLEEATNDYIMNDEGRINKKYFFGPYKNQSDRNKPVPIEGLMRSLYTQLHPQGVSMTEVRQLCSPIFSIKEVAPSEAAKERLRMILDKTDA